MQPLSARESDMAKTFVIVGLIVAVPVGLLVWLAIGVKRSMNRNDNRKE